jgi:ATP-dependent DNA helicase RecG
MAITTEAAIRQMLAGGETGTVEFKIKAPRPSELAERICGMANTRTGGTILFGVEDATGQIVGISRLNETIDTILRATRLIKPAVTLQSPAPEIHVLDGRRVIVIEVPANNGTLYQAGAGCWIRKGTHTIPMTTAEIETHLNTYGSTRWEAGVCSRATIEDIDPELVERYLAYRAERSRLKMRHTSREDLLIGLECAAFDSQAHKIRPTNAGMLLFGYDPQLQIPQSEIVCIRYADRLGVGKYIDRKNILGNLPELIDKAADFLELHTRVGAEIQGFKREDIPEYPMEALREAVVNAVVHRDYSRIGETVRIFVYSDRVEIHSPGLLLPGITTEDLARMRVASRPRNPLIAQFLRDIPGYMERIGTGIRLMVNEMRQLGLPDPEFIEQHEFVVIFRSGPRKTMSPVEELNERQLIGLQIIHEKGSINSGEYCAATGASERTALRDLRELVEKGALITRGKKRWLRYYLP